METKSAEKLTREKQTCFSDYEKHTSNIAKIKAK